MQIGNKSQFWDNIGEEHSRQREFQVQMFFGGSSRNRKEAQIVGSSGDKSFRTYRGPAWAPPL